MGKFTSTPVVSLLLADPADPEGESVTVEIGGTAEVTVAGPRGSEIIISGTVVGLSLRQRTQSAKSCRIYDAIPTNHYQTDDLAGIHNATDYFEGDQIAIEDENEKIHIVRIADIRAITAEAAAEGDSSESTDESSVTETA